MNLYTCAEMDLLGSSLLGNVISVAISIPTVTSATRESVEQAAVRKQCCNQLVLVTMDMCNPDTRRRDKLVVVATDVWVEQFGRDNKHLRDTGATLTWTLGMINGGFLDVCKRSLKQLSSMATLRWCEFLFPNT